MKIEKETFRSCAETVSVLSKEAAVATVTSGIAMWGATLATSCLWTKHPILANICGALSAGIVTGMVMGTEKLQDWIFDDSEYDANKLTDLIYGSKEETIED